MTEERKKNCLLTSRVVNFMQRRRFNIKYIAEQSFLRLAMCSTVFYNTSIDDPLCLLNSYATRFGSNRYLFGFGGVSSLTPSLCQLSLHSIFSFSLEFHLSRRVLYVDEGKENRLVKSRCRLPQPIASTLGSCISQAHSLPQVSADIYDDLCSVTTYHCSHHLLCQSYPYSRQFDVLKRLNSPGPMSDPSLVRNGFRCCIMKV